MGSGLSNNRAKNSTDEPKNPPKKSSTDTKDTKAVEQADQVKRSSTEPTKNETKPEKKPEKKKAYVPEFVFHSDKGKIILNNSFYLQLY